MTANRLTGWNPLEGEDHAPSEAYPPPPGEWGVYENSEGKPIFVKTQCSRGWAAPRKGNGHVYPFESFHHRAVPHDLEPEGGIY